jgi:DNA-binding beta-propeller fold protein YncE
VIRLHTTFSIISAIVVIFVMVIAVQGNNNIINSLLVHSKRFSAEALPSSTSSPFSLVQTIVIPNVNGRIDHMAIDIRGQKLFVAELGNNSLDIIDLKEAKRIQSVGSNNVGLLNEPQSVLFIPELNRIFVSNGGDGTVDVFDEVIQLYQGSKASF